MLVRFGTKNTVGLCSSEITLVLHNEFEIGRSGAANEQVAA
jgi:hypothetical protein